MNTKVFEGRTYDCSHGSWFDRGSADSWYSRPLDPHCYPNGTGRKPRLEANHPEEIEAYVAGYKWNEQFGGKKDWD